MIWHLKLAGFEAGRQKNPSGAISGDKLTVFLEGKWVAYDCFSSVGTPGKATPVIFLNVGAVPESLGGSPRLGRCGQCAVSGPGAVSRLCANRAGALYAQRFIHSLVRAGVNVHLVVSPLGRRLLHDELGMETVDPAALARLSTRSWIQTARRSCRS